MPASAYLAFLLAAAGCAEQSALHLQIVRDDGRPDVGVEVVIVPVDPQALFDSLTAASRTPPPRFPELEHEMRNFQRREQPVVGNGGWQATRDSVEALADSLQGADRRTWEYRSAYGRLRRLYDRLGQRTAARDRAARAEYRDLADRAAQAAEAMRRWERSAYAGYDSLLARRIARTGRQGVRAVSDSMGTVQLMLAPGRWWLHARRRLRDNPFLERAWNVPVTTNRLVPVRVRLTAANARLEWRH